MVCSDFGNSEINVGRYQFGAAYVDDKIKVISGSDEHVQSLGIVAIRNARYRCWSG